MAGKCTAGGPAGAGRVLAGSQLLHHVSWHSNSGRGRWLGAHGGRRAGGGVACAMVALVGSVPGGRLLLLQGMPNTGTKTGLGRTDRAGTAKARLCYLLHLELGMAIRGGALLVVAGAVGR
jgi:hypothetical protein